MGNQRDKWRAGCWAVVAPHGRAGTAATCALAREWHICHRAQHRGTQAKGKTKAGTWCPHVLGSTAPYQAGGTGCQRVPSPALGLQGSARTPKPSGHPSHPPFPSCIPVLGGKGEQQEQGWPCVPGVSPWRWRAAPLQRGCLYLSLPPAGRNKGLFVLWRVWSLQEEWGGVQDQAGGDIRVPGTQLGGPMGLGSTGVIRGAKLRQNPHESQLQVGFLAQVLCQPFMVGTLQTPPSPGQGDTAWQPWLCSLDLRGRAVFSVDLPDETSSPRRQRPPASRSQPRKSCEM